MINFRFHVISLIAVFLAIGLGIVVGSTVVDDAIVSRLERDIDEVRAESAQRNRENDELRDELEVARAYEEQTAAYAVEARLAGIPVAVIAERGIDDDAVNDAADLLVAAGANVPGVLWLEPQWRLDEVEQVRALKESTGATGSKVAARALALDALATRLIDGPAPVVEGGEQPVDLIAALRSAGFLGFEGDEAALAEFAARPARALVLTGNASELEDAEVTVAAARAFAEAGVATTVGEVYSEGENAPSRGASVAPLRSDDELAKEVSTVDDVDLLHGRVAAVLALEALATGVVGHYGYGDGADGPVPEAVS